MKPLSAQADANVENVYFLCKYPDRYAKKQKKEKPIIEQYIKYLIMEKLNKDSVDIVADLLDELPWDNENIVDFLQKCIMKLTFYGKFIDMNVVACLMTRMKKTQDVLPIRVVDAVLEDIICGLEKNDYRDSQHRLLAIRFLAELYNFTVINTDIIFTVLNVLADCNDECKYPDPEDDAFRIRMVCTLLDTCSKHFEKGGKKAKLDVFLKQFQRYILSKSYVSLDLEFMILDTFEIIRPDMKLYKTYEEADEECKKIPSGESHMEGGEEKRERYDDGQDEYREYEKEGNEGQYQYIEEDGKDYDRGEKETKFEDELNSVLEESLKEAKKQGASKKIGDIPVPVIKKDSEEGKEGNKFNFILKKGAKPIVRKLEIPKDSKLAIANKKRMNEDDVLYLWFIF